ncbi:uncharacterized protein FOMMEDRAFT_40480, partial [Fomitiporia mediterranea MF3/22]|uniref:uncharacterized protein n=1 Tax=Fomitiporia mediterranea (strain MF3/22) TaxID=694068 RepID=UPI0004407E16
KHTKKHEKKDPGLTQLHFCIDQSILRTCTLCGLSYTRGAADDENLHKTHCARVQRGMEWGREEEKGIRKEGGTAAIVEEDVTIGKGERGRIVAVKPSATGRIGCKASGYLNTVNLALSAPDIPPSALESCKVYLFLLRTPRCIKEKIVGCVVAQRISSAMQIASLKEVASLEKASETLVHVEGDLYCHPDDLPTPMGIPRLFVSSAHRRKGIAHALLTAAARTFVHGYRLDVAKGEIAFSQPTSAGRAVMEKWGNGGVRVYKE